MVEGSLYGVRRPSKNTVSLVVSRLYFSGDGTLYNLLKRLVFLRVKRQKLLKLRRNPQIYRPKLVHGVPKLGHELKMFIVSQIVILYIF
jgi:hypothetical protein